MTYQMRRRAEVEEDILSQATFIAHNSRDAAVRFLESVEDTVSSLQMMPGRGSLKRLGGIGHGEIRSWAVKNFPNHLILYEIQDTIVLIWPVIHGAQNYPRLLRNRIGPPEA